MISRYNRVAVMPPKAGSIWYCLKRDLDAVKFEMDIVTIAGEIEGKDPLAEWRTERNRMLNERNKVGSMTIVFFLNLFKSNNI